MKYTFPQVSACPYVSKNCSASPVTQKVRPHLRNIRPVDRILNQVMFFHNLATYLYETHFNIMFPAILCCLKLSVLIITFDWTVRSFSIFPMRVPLHHYLYYHEIIRLVTGSEDFNLSATGHCPEPD